MKNNMRALWRIAIATTVLMVLLVVSIGPSRAYTAPSMSWQVLSPSPPLPPARDSASIAYDTADAQMVLFGGESSAGICYGDTWTYKGGAWTQQTPGQSPTVRIAGAMTYDAADGYVLLFGGACSSTLGDTWEFHNGQWVQLNPATSPSPRYDASMTYDATDGYVLLYGGYGQVLVGGKPANATFADSWEFKAGSWQQLSPSQYPAARDSAAMAYDSTYGKVILFGGEVRGTSSFTLLSDTWAFSNGGWTELTASGGPTARLGAQMDYFPAASGVLLFGGGGVTGGGKVSILQDIWVNAEGSWTQLTSVNNTPSPRYYGSFAYDGADGKIFMFGGIGQQADLDDSWELNGPPAAPQGNNLDLVLVIVIVAVVAVAAILAMMMVMRRRRQGAPVAPMPPQAGYAQPGQTAAPSPYASGSTQYPAQQFNPQSPAPVVAQPQPMPVAYPQVPQAPPQSPSPTGSPPNKAIFCPRCGTGNLGDAAFCKKCGRALPSTQPR